jgi:tetratricopeptide (TPR) repeat protein
MREESVEIGAACPHCGAFNEISATRCAECGESLATKSVSGYGRTARTVPAPPPQEIGHEFDEELQESLTRQKKRSEFGVRVLLLAGIVVIASLLALTAWRVMQERLRQDRLDEMYRVAVMFLQEGQYVAARDSLLQLVDEAPDYPNAESRLQEAYLQIAETFVSERQWHHALEQLQSLWTLAPGDSDVRVLLIRVYDELIAGAVNSRDFIEAFNLRADKLLLLGT